MRGLGPLAAKFPLGCARMFDPAIINKLLLLLAFVLLVGPVVEVALVEPLFLLLFSLTRFKFLLL